MHDEKREGEEKGTKLERGENIGEGEEKEEAARMVEWEDSKRSPTPPKYPHNDSNVQTPCLTLEGVTM